MKRLLHAAAIGATTLLSLTAAQAQYLYGTNNFNGASPAFVRWNLSNNTLSTVVADYNLYQPTTARDTGGKQYFLMVASPGGAQGTASDTVVTLNLTTTARTRKPVPRGGLPFPQFYAGKLVSMSPGGMAAFNLANNQYTITDTAFKVTAADKSDFDYTGNRYILYKRTQAAPDTVFVYSMATKAVQKWPVPIGGTEMAYDPAGNRAIVLGALKQSSGPAPTYGVWAINLATGVHTQLSSIASTGVFVYSGTIDPISQTYYAVRTTGTNMIHLLEYRLLTGMSTQYTLSTPGIGFLQYFKNTGSSASVATVAYEPFSIAPNPTAAALRLTLAADAWRTAGPVEVCNLQGAVVMRQRVAGGETTLDLSRLAAGTYNVRLQIGEKIYSKLVQKQ